VFGRLIEGYDVLEKISNDEPVPSDQIRNQYEMVPEPFQTNSLVTIPAMASFSGRPTNADGYRPRTVARRNRSPTTT